MDVVRGSQVATGEESVVARSDRKIGVTAVALIALAGLAFGAGDQYLGSLSAWPVATAISLMSAPWLLIAFFAGCAQRRLSVGALVGLIVSMTALMGYCVMSVTPLEGVNLGAGPQALISSVLAQGHTFLCALVTGPVFGYLGAAWRDRKFIVSAILAGAVLIGEPVVRAFNLESGPAVAFVAEMLAGLTLATYFALHLARARHRQVT